MKYSLFCLFALLAYTLAVPLRQNSTEFLSNSDAFKKDSRIVGGISTTIQLWPWNLSYRLRGSHICGAIIISANRALTAARCFNGRHELHDYSVLASSTSRTPDANGVVVGIKRFVRNPRYNVSTHTFDIAILYLANSLTFGPGIRPIALPLPGAAIPYGTNAIVSGWGLTIKDESETAAQDLQFTTIRLIRNEDCNVHYPNRITPDMVCAGARARGACAGDVGAPLVANGVLVGVHSWQIGCGRNFPGVYSRLSHLHNANFIRDHLIV